MELPLVQNENEIFVATCVRSLPHCAASTSVWYIKHFTLHVLTLSHSPNRPVTSHSCSSTLYSFTVASTPKYVLLPTGTEKIFARTVFRACMSVRVKGKAVPRYRPGVAQRVPGS